MHLSSAPLAAVLFGNDGGNDIDLTVYAPTATVNFSGSRHQTTTISYRERGSGAGENDMLSVFGGLEINKQTVKFSGRNGTPDDVTWSEGLTYYDLSSKKLRCYDGSAWRDLF